MGFRSPRVIPDGYYNAPADPPQAFSLGISVSDDLVSRAASVVRLARSVRRRSRRSLDAAPTLAALSAAILRAPPSGRVDATDRRGLRHIDLPRALLRGRYMAALARME